MNSPGKVIEVIDQFISEQSVSPSSRLTYRRSLIKFFSYLTGHDTWNPAHEDEVRTVTTSMIIDFKDDQNKRHQSEFGTALHIAVIKRFFYWTAQKGIHENIAIGVKAPKRQHGLCKDPLTLEQATLFINSVDRSTSFGMRNYAMLCLLLYNGLRGVEVRRIDNKDIITSNGKTFIYIQGKGHVNKDHKIPVSGIVASAINEYQTTKRAYEPDDPLFLSIGFNNRNNRISMSLIKKIVHNHLVKLGLKTERVSTHSLRHTAASILLDNGLMTPALQTFMRHSSLSITDVYIKQISEKNKSDDQATELLARLIPVSNIKPELPI